MEKKLWTTWVITHSCILCQGTWELPRKYFIFRETSCFTFGFSAYRKIKQQSSKPTSQWNLVELKTQEFSWHVHHVHMQVKLYYPKRDIQKIHKHNLKTQKTWENSPKQGNVQSFRIIIEVIDDFNTSLQWFKFVNSNLCHRLPPIFSYRWKFPDIWTLGPSAP